MKSKGYLLAGLIIFAAFFGSSIFFESPLLLYIASAIPIFIVPFLPDIRTSQRLKPEQKGVEIVKLISDGGPEWLVVSFRPGTVNWSRRTLIVPFEQAPTVESVPTDDYTAALTVLQYDLRVRKGRQGRFGILLSNLSERTTGMPFTVNEVNRLLIPLNDIAESMPMPMPASAAVTSHSVELQA
ncbi:hypothetical protein PV433_30050 [Paenibacillus sp. GYB004]|uniref:hypothetical protein n=1 Tax=Paenibacillus sp. GYB004 TaxID=2994393 RepID=UPI002F9668D4